MNYFSIINSLLIHFFHINGICIIFDILHCKEMNIHIVILVFKVKL